ncbi:MAG: class IV adenylate cyclase [Candidatus Fermentibacteraceae bacterium]|nr:class IV adenylate cyclase [Candidatus Fermentibacteraceae bacterium]
MFTEVELKYQVNDFVRVRDKLRDASAELVSESSQEENAVLDLSDGSLGDSSVLLRLREFRNEVILTVKKPGPSGPMKIRDEYETVLSTSFQDAMELFAALGYRQVFHYSKTREVWSLGKNIHICLDTLYFGKFVEVETDSMSRVSSTSKLLGLDPHEGLSSSYRKLQLVYDSDFRQQRGDV